MELLNKIKDILSSNNTSNEIGISTKEIKNFNCKCNAPFGKPYARGNENTILSKHCFLSTDTAKTKVNNNVFVLGGSEPDWLESIVHPNLLQVNGSYIIVDPDGKLKETSSEYFEKHGYIVNVFDPDNPDGSSNYNPLTYLKNERDVLSMATILHSISLEEDGKNDLFLQEYTLLKAITFYLSYYHENDSERVKNLFEIFENAEMDIATTISLLDKVLGHSGGVACQKYYSDFKKAPSEIVRETVNTVAQKLAAFSIALKKCFFLGDEIHLNKLADVPTVTYIITKSKDISCNVAASLMISQAYDAMIENIGNKEEDSHFAHKLRFILPGEYTLTIPDFRMKIIAARKYGLSFMMYIRSFTNIMKSNAKVHQYEDMMPWLSSFDTLVFLGGKDSISIEYVDKKVNTKSFDEYNNFSHQACPLLPKEGIRNIRDGYCLVLIRGNKPFYDQKYRSCDIK